MLSVVFYKPGSDYVNSNGKPHMGALVFTFCLNEQTYYCPLWLARDDMDLPLDRAWLKEKAIDAFAGIVDDALATDLTCVQPTREDEFAKDEEADSQLDS